MPVSPLFVSVVPAMPLIGGLLFRPFPGLAPKLAAPLSGAACASAFLLAFFPESGVGLVKLDALSITLVLLVSFLGTMVLRFATRYLEGDPAQPRFLSWMCLTLASVLTLVISNHLLLLLAAWTAASLCLHRLLLHHPERPSAVFSARKKFVYSRLAEVFLLTASGLLYHGHGTWHIDEITASIASGNHSGLPAAAFLLALCAMLKSAQFPFHSWLPDTMDTPTPVSALMHAGIINGGGFLVLRLAPVFTAVPVAMWMLAVVGAVTAVFGAVVMLAQPGVKRALAFSTIAQMGFMMLQCGLGAWGLALLHIVAHSLYKAHAFLRAGSTIGAVPRAAIPLTIPALAFGVASAAVLVTAGNAALHAFLPGHFDNPVVFPVVLGVAVAYGIARVTSAHPASMVRAVAFAGGIVMMTMGLHTAAGRLLSLPEPPPVPAWLAIAVSAAFVGLFLFQSLLWRASSFRMGRILYVHALNGFYVSSLVNRLLNRLWPSQPSV